MTPEELDIEQALPRMQELASRLWSRAARHRPVPARLFRRIGFVPGARARIYRLSRRTP